MPMPSGDKDLYPGHHHFSSCSPLSQFLHGAVESRSIKGIYYRRARKVGALDASPTADLKKEILVNVGGRRYLLPWSTLDEFPLSRLSKLRFCRSHEEIAQLCDDYDEDNQEFFFDRSPSAFGVIVSFLAAGKLVHLREMCVLSFQEELTYWGIEEANLERCCLRKLLRKLDELDELRREEALQEQREACRPAVHTSRWGLFMNRLREMVENPQSGLPGKVFACLSILFVATTAVSLCVSTMPDLRAEEDQKNCAVPALQDDPHATPNCCVLISRFNGLCEQEENFSGVATEPGPALHPRDKVLLSWRSFQRRPWARHAHQTLAAGIGTGEKTRSPDAL